MLEALGTPDSYLQKHLLDQVIQTFNGTVWQTADAECTEEKVQGHVLRKVLNDPGKLTSNTVIILLSP